MAAARSRSAVKRLVSVVLLAAVAALSGVYVADLGGGSHPSGSPSTAAEEEEKGTEVTSSSSPSSSHQPPSFLTTEAGFPLIQCYLAPDDVRAEHPIKEDFQAAWLADNPALRSEFFDSARARQFIADHYGHDAPELRRYQSHAWFTERADYFRMLAVYTLGGLYVDNDVEPLVPVDRWLSMFGYGSEIARNLLVVGVEMPRSRGGLSLQIVNFNFLATHPRHTALRAVLRVMDSASEVMREGADNVMFRTGPLAFTRGILDWLGHEVEPKATDERGLLFERESGGETWRLLVGFGREK